jgi:hypothetical protein
MVVLVSPSNGGAHAETTDAQAAARARWHTAWPVFMERHGTSRCHSFGAMIFQELLFRFQEFEF